MLLKISMDIRQNTEKINIVEFEYLMFTISFTSSTWLSMRNLVFLISPLYSSFSSHYMPEEENFLCEWDASNSFFSTYYW